MWLSLGSLFPTVTFQDNSPNGTVPAFPVDFVCECVLDPLFLPMSSVPQIKDIVTSLFAYTPTLTSPIQFVLCIVARFSVFLTEKTLPSCHFPACSSRWLPISYHAESRFFWLSAPSMIWFHYTFPALLTMIHFLLWINILFAHSSVTLVT